MDAQGGIHMEFFGADRARAFRRAIDYWYKNLRNEITLNEFAKKCVWKEAEKGILVIFRNYNRSNKLTWL